MAARNKTTILDGFQVAPSPGSVQELSIPLTCSDMMWIGLPPVHRLTFYQHPVSKSIFIETIVPGLKNSLSLALKHFPSLSGNLIMHANSTKPDIRYVDGDSVPFSIAEAETSDFDYLVSNQPRICSEFYPFIPRLPNSTESGGSKKYPLIAFQVTMFPGYGFCIGITHNHVLGDGTSTYAFIRAWSTISKFSEDEAAKRNELSLIYDREVMTIHTKDLDDIFWRSLIHLEMIKKNMNTSQLEFFTEETEKVCSTFVISPDDINKLKKHVSKTSSKHFSTFSVVCGYVWTCIIKSRNATMNIAELEDEEEYFIFVADCRSRTNPPIPGNYFGNCLAQFKMSAKNRELSGDEGFFIATELISETIKRKLRYNGGVLKVIETFLADLKEVKDITKLMSIAGSPRHNHYNMDFGWGKPRKVEITSIYSTGAISLSGCRDDSGSWELGLALPKIRMDTFTKIFKEGLHALRW